LTVCASKST